jgi:hypothetical protein
VESRSADWSIEEIRRGQFSGPKPGSPHQNIYSATYIILFSGIQQSSTIVVVHMRALRVRRIISRHRRLLPRVLDVQQGLTALIWSQFDVLWCQLDSIRQLLACVRSIMLHLGLLATPEESETVELV